MNTTRKELKQLIPIIVAGVLILSGLGAVATPNTEAIKHVTRTVSFSQFSVQEKHDVVRVDLKETDAVLMKPNYYMVPVRTETFTFPFGTKILDVVCTPKELHHQTLVKGLQVAPFPVITKQLLSYDESQKTAPPHAINTWYEYNVGTGLIGSNDRGVIVTVRVFPVQYDQVTKEVTWTPTMDITIGYVPPETHSITFSDEYKFIVLAPASFSDVLAPLIQHKNTYRKIPTKLITLDDIYNSVYFPANGRDDPEKIKYFIKNAIEQWNTNFVLLVGGNSAFPTRPTHIHIDANPPDNEVFVSDLYYADIYNQTSEFCSWDSNNNNVFGEYNWGTSHLYDEVDLYPDVALGRLACTNTNQVTTVVNKIITYETAKAYTQDWFTNLIVLGGDTFPGDENHIDEGEYANLVTIDIMDEFTPTKLWASNGKLSGLFPTGVERITTTINAGAGFVDFSGHGNEECWATHPHEKPSIWLPTPIGQYKNSDVGTLQNGDKLPIIVTSACSIGKFNINANCFSWSFLANPNGGGIGSFGATALGWGYEGEWVIEGLIEGIALDTFRGYKEKQTTMLGEMWSKAINYYIFPDMIEYDYKTIEEWILFGDPTLAIADDLIPPEKPATPTGPTSGVTNVEYTYSSSTTDPNPDDQLWYNFTFGDNTYSGWIGPFASGVVASAKHTWTTPGQYDVEVKAKDSHEVESLVSDPLSVTIAQNENHPPAVPDTPSGPTSGEVGIEYTYTTNVVVDPDGDPVSYNFSWGDGTFSDWVSTPSAKHKWTSPGTFDVKVKAKDDKEAQSDWSAPLQVTIIKKTPVLSIESIEGGTNEITAKIKNIGTADATDVEWKISITGGLVLFVSEATDTIESLTVGATKEVKLVGRPIIGIGYGLGKLTALPKITITASAPDTEPVEDSMDAQIRFKKVITE